MKFFTRIATAITATLVALFVATPAFAATGHDEVVRVDFTEQFSTAGQPLNVVPILITGAVLLLVVLLLAAWLSSLFKPANASSED